MFTMYDTRNHKKRKVEDDLMFKLELDDSSLDSESLPMSPLLSPAKSISTVSTLDDSPAKRSDATESYSPYDEELFNARQMGSPLSVPSQTAYSKTPEHLDRNGRTVTFVPGYGILRQAPMRVLFADDYVNEHRVNALPWGAPPNTPVTPATSTSEHPKSKLKQSYCMV